MTEKEEAYFNGFAINEGAYFYRRNFDIDEREIKNIFATIRDNAHSHTNIVEIIKEPIAFAEGRNALCTLKVFLDKNVPSFLRTIPEEFQKKEVLICYFLLIEIDEYLVLFTRHANGLSSFKNKHTPIMGNVLAGALISDNTVFTQMRMGNMSLNQFSLRNKSYESDDLSQSMPTHGAGRHILKTTRIQNDDETVTLGLSTSRVSKIGSERKTIASLCEWADSIIRGIEAPYDVTTSLMGHFSTPVRWKDYKDTLIPSYLLIDFHELMNHIERENLIVQYKSGDDMLPIESERFFSHLYKRLSGCKSLTEKTAHQEYSSDGSWDLLDVVLQQNGIRLKGYGRLDNLYLVNDDGGNTKLFTYITNHKCFFVGFEDVQFIYQGNQLHMDGDILNSIESILSIFVGVPEMGIVTSEKGTPTIADVEFANDTVFYVVENTFRNEAPSHIICDDMGYECADHIVLSDNKISFVHSKGKGETSLSASAFQEVVGQALKNIGNMRYMDVAYKVNSWMGRYFPNSSIDVCRVGNLDTFEESYRRTLIAPNGIKEVCLAVDFVSKSELREAFEALRDGRPLRQKHAVSQMIWLISSFISSCKDADMQCRIFCRE
ncbi:MAG: hypothetical protein K2L17_03770 [Muribaculaceae bacterium]|nr:hypothetical protein [Muribaculaceae bacterium]